MNFLQQFIADIQHPVFITGAASHKIQFANSFALSQANTSSLSGNSLYDHLHLYPTLINGKLYGQFFREWYEVEERTVENNSDVYCITELKPRQDLPFGRSYENWKNMVEVMLHRLRSPLTGISGYIELMEDENSNQDLEKRFTSINKGFKQVFDIMNELEELYQFDAAFDDEGFLDFSVQEIIREIVAQFSDEAQQRIQLHTDDPNSTVHSDPESVRPLLRQLIQNAVRHSTGNISISINQQEPMNVVIENQADNLSPEISEKAFFPFVTSRADDLGIGLTTALLHAKRIGGTLFFEPKNNKVAVRLVFPFL